MTLYEIQGEFLELLDMAETETDEQVITDTLSVIQSELEVKAEGYAAVIKELDAEVKKFDEEISRLILKKKVLENNSKRIKDRIKNAMEMMDVPEIKTDKFKLKVTKNGGKAPLEITGNVPDNFLKVIYETDTDKIRKALEDGEKLDFAELRERGTHLRIS